jgi:hypothetical protein
MSPSAPPFLTLDEVAAAVHLTVKTLRNNYKSVRETIEVRGLPPLRTLRVGSHWLVARRDFEAWITDIVDGKGGSNPILVAQPAVRREERRSGRPRKHSGRVGDGASGR